MDVLQVLGARGVGGAETYFVDLVTALSRVGVSEGAALRKNALRETALTQAGVPYTVHDFGGPLDWTTKPSLAKLLAHEHVRVAIAWMNRAARHLPAGAWARIGRLGGYYKLKNYRSFDCLVGNTRDIADYLRREGWPAERTHYIPNFASAIEMPPTERAQFDTPPDAPLLLGVGRLHSSKAHDVSLHALALLPETYLWIAGAGPEEHALKALAHQLGVANRVRFLGWRADAPALYRAADVCVFPSRFEPLGNVVLQAWVYGLPVVAAASQGPSGLIHDGEDGILTPVDDPAALAAAAKHLAANPPVWRRLAEAGRERVAAEFSEAAVVAQWRALFARYGVA